MSVTYVQLLDATIQYLQDLKAEGERWVAVRPESLALLTPPADSTAAVRPRTAPRTTSSSPSAPVAPSAAFFPPETPRATAAPAPERSAIAAPEPLPGPDPGLTSTLAAAGPDADKAERLAEVRQRVLPCTRCAHLAMSRKNVVFGVGNPEASLMFVGEAPGADEDVKGEPFVGAAGQLLTRIIQTMGFSRETVYIANVLKCRPDTPGQTSGNRKPTPEEMKTCLPYLLEQIRIIQPKAIVALGATAMEGLFGRAIPITKARGQWQTFQGTPVMPTFHPSYLLRNQAPAIKRQVWEDMLQVLEKLEVPITDKQRNYFK